MARLSTMYIRSSWYVYYNAEYLATYVPLLVAMYVLAE